MKTSSVRRVALTILPAVVFLALFLVVDYVLFRNGDPIARGLAELSLPFIVIVPTIILRRHFKSTA